MTARGDLMARSSLVALGSFAIMASAITILVVIPKIMLRQVEPMPELAPYTEQQLRGRQVYIANGCIYCHSQQIRDPSFTTDVDRGWGSRPTVPEDYVYDRPHLLGTMRTGPDLINIGQRIPSEDWHLLHLYDPRALVEWSTMPSFPFLFEEKRPEDVGPDDRVVPSSGSRAPADVTIVATPDALALVDYLISLNRQYPVADSLRATDQVIGIANGSMDGAP